MAEIDGRDDQHCESAQLERSQSEGPAERRDITRPLLTTALSNLAVPVAAFASIPILAVSLGAEGRGQVAAAVAPLLLAVSLASLGLPEATTYFIARRSQQARRLLLQAAGGTVVAGVASTAATLIASDLLASGDATTKKLIAMATLAITPTVIISLLRGLAAGLAAWRLVNAEKYLTTACRLIGLLAFLFLGQLTVTTATLTLSLSPVVGGLPYLWLGKWTKQLGSKDRRARVGTWRYAASIWVGSLSGMLLGRLDQVVMIPLAGAKQLGYYAVAASVSELALVINHAVRDVTFATDSQSEDARRLTMTARLSGALSMAVAAVASVTMWLWLPLFFGDEFRPAAWPIVLLLLAAALGVPGSVAGAGLSARGRPGLRSIGLVIATVVNVFALLALVPPLGAVGAAIATLVGNVIAANINIMLMRHLFRAPARAFYAISFNDFRTAFRALASLNTRRS